MSNTKISNKEDLLKLISDKNIKLTSSQQEQITVQQLEALVKFGDYLIPVSEAFQKLNGKKFLESKPEILDELSKFGDKLAPFVNSINTKSDHHVKSLLDAPKETIEALVKFGDNLIPVYEAFQSKSSGKKFLESKPEILDELSKFRDKLAPAVNKLSDFQMKNFLNDPLKFNNQNKMNLNDAKEVSFTWKTK